mgnify:CR=1 FL=1
MRKITRPKTIANKIIEFMLEKKAYDILVIDVKHLTSLTDIFVICTSDSSPQSKAIANHIKDELLKYNLKPSNIEGYEQMKWILIDYINVVIHIFDKDSRDYYNFENLWSDGKTKAIKNQ